MNPAMQMLFDEQYYLQQEDIRQAKLHDASFDLYAHFEKQGIYEGRSPSFTFDLNFVRNKLARYLGIKIGPSEVISAFLDLSPAERFVPNCWFSPWSFRRLYGQRHEEIESLSDYELFEYYTANVREQALSPNGLFNEEFYRVRYPDIAQAVAQGDFGSGFQHFVYQGAADGRINLPGFDQKAYSAERGGQTEKDCVLAHHAELQRIVPWFDEAFYLSIYDDAHELKRRETIRSGLEHFLVLGFSEGRLPHPALLDDMEGATGDAWSFFAARSPSPRPRISLEEASRLLRHLAGRELRKDRHRLAGAIWPFVENPPLGGRFDEVSYLAVNTDVAQALAGAPPNSAILHWHEFGLREQRVAPGSNLFADRTVTHADFLERRCGVNFFGPLSAASGLGGAARGFIAALRAANVAVDTYDVSQLISRNLPLDLFAASDLAYPINFFFLNPDQVLPFVQRFGTAIFDHRVNVACWVWELSSPRPEWRAGLSAFDLIVTPSDFCTASFAAFTNRPVVTCPYVVDEVLLRAELGAASGHPWIARLEAEKAAGKRIVLFIMDASSYVTRKGVDVFLALAARLEAERPGQCVFVLKTHSKDYSNSTYRVNGSSVLVINEVLKFPDLLKLKSLADVYVSPHRSEGFGLNIFESLALGVPVLCSAYGGGVDRLPEDYPYRIPGRLVEIGRDMGPYRQDAVWFEPDLDAACEMLAGMLGRRPQNGRLRQVAKSIRAQLAIDVVGARLRDILERHCALNVERTDAALQKFAFFTNPHTDECFEFGLPPGLDEAAWPERLRQAAWQCLSPVFSVITPTYNTDPAFLNELYQDLVAQSFAGWEWCLCDDGSTRPETLAVLYELRRQDARVRVTFLPRNAGISAATNAAVAVANGRYLVMVDHDDRLHPALLQTYHDAIQRDGSAAVFYCDEDKLDPSGAYVESCFKPDWSPEHITSSMYALHCLCIRKRDFLALEGYRSAYDGAQDHDFVLRVAATGAAIRHVDQLLYHWRKTAGSTAARSEAKEFAIEAGRRAVADYMSRLSVPCAVEHGLFPGTYRVRPTIRPGRVSLNILTACTPMRGGEQTYLERFVRSILAHETSVDFEIRMIVDDGRLDLAAPLTELDPRVRLVPFRRHSINFSFAEKANFAATTSECDRIVLLNDDMEAMDGEWLPALMEQIELPGVGVVGGRLLHDDGTIQHAGIVLGIYGTCAHVFEGMRREDIGPNGLTHMIRNYSAVTGALMAFRRSTFDLVGGFDMDFPIDYNDVDFCLRVIEAGLRVVYTPFAELRHFESRSAKRMVRDELDTQRFRNRWSAYISRDPHYNRNLSRNSVMFEEPQAAAAAVPEHPKEAAPAPARTQLQDAQPLPAPMRRRLIELMTAQGLVVSDQPNLHVVVNERAIHPLQVDGMVYRFELPEHVRELRIVSRSHVPSSVHAESEDARRLGVCLGDIVLHVDGATHEIAIADPTLSDGFHPVETNGATMWRWTDGDARLPLALLNGAATNGGAILELKLLWAGAYWVRPEQLLVPRENVEQPPLHLQ